MLQVIVAVAGSDYRRELFVVPEAEMSKSQVCRAMAYVTFDWTEVENRVLPEVLRALTQAHLQKGMKSWQQVRKRWREQFAAPGDLEALEAVRGVGWLVFSSTRIVGATPGMPVGPEHGHSMESQQ